MSIDQLNSQIDMIGIYPYINHIINQKKKKKKKKSNIIITINIITITITTIKIIRRDGTIEAKM